MSRADADVVFSRLLRRSRLSEILGGVSNIEGVWSKVLLPSRYSRVRIGDNTQVLVI